MLLAGVPFLPYAMRAFARESAGHAGHEAALFIGTYTSGSGATGESKGVYTSRWNAMSGELTPFVLAAATPNPTFLALSPGQPQGSRVLYAVNEIGDYQGGHDGSVAAWRVDPATGKLTALNTVDSGGNGPCHISIDRTGHAAFAANYGSGSVASFRLTEKGGLSPSVSHFQFAGHGPNAKRQEGPHTHCVTVAPGNRFLLASDLGLDRIMMYRLDADTAKLTPAAEPFWSAKPGSGPRHTLFHPNGRWVYSVNELASTIDVLGWDAEHGHLHLLSSVSTLPGDFHPDDNRPAELATDREGRFLYVSNRGHDSMGVFSIAPEAGGLTLVQRDSCGGKNPRHFALDPSGAWLLVANQDTRDVVIFRRDKGTGKLSPTGKKYHLDAPVCLVFAT